MQDELSHCKNELEKSVVAKNVELLRAALSSASTSTQDFVVLAADSKRFASFFSFRVVDFLLFRFMND